MSDHDNLQHTIDQLNESLTGFEWDADPEDDLNDETFNVLCFTNHGHRYAFLGEDVREVLGNTSLTALPGAPPYIEGVMIHRRNVIGVLNLNQWLYPDEQWGQEEQDRIILIEHGTFMVGVHAGQKAHIEQWPRSSQTHSGIDILSPRVRGYCLGVQEYPNHETTLLLNIKKILEDAAIRG